MDSGDLAFIDDILFSELIPELNKIKPDNQYGWCCNEQMKHIEDEMICEVCNNVIQYVDDMFITPHSEITQYDNDGNVRHGKQQEKSTDDRISLLVQECQNRIMKQTEERLEIVLIKIACEYMFKILNNKIKKKENRKQLFAACIYLVAISKGYIMTENRLIKIFKLNVSGISQGLQYIYIYKAQYGLDLDVDPFVYSYMIIELLSQLIYKDRHGIPQTLNTPSNREFCTKLVTFMLRNNIVYNTKLKTKCSGAIFYLIKLLGLTEKKKNEITSAMKICQNTMINTYNILILPEIQAKLHPRYRIAT